jgi:hypothetical protein
MDKKSGSGSGINNPDHISESFEQIFCFKIIKFFDAEPGSGMEKLGSVMEKLGSGMEKLGSGILDVFMRTMIRGSVLLDGGSGSCSFLLWPST